eukprot:TRINITY_DN1175_c0_g1_i1.p1 TRINITY_DN1175_c0_g1~~TRINITY_DN1175_c0_g1_i1.p1  ORF type:complete len:1383 (+),score=276.07 TRINITY_DN1175_c0_g1_i1:257-4150(+)
MLYEDAEEEEEARPMVKLKKTRARTRELEEELKNLVDGEYDEDAEPKDDDDGASLYSEDGAVKDELEAHAEPRPKRQRVIDDQDLIIHDDGIDTSDAIIAAQRFFGGGELDDLDELNVPEEEEKKEMVTEAEALRKVLLPEDIAKHCLTETDDMIRSYDVPERIQLMRIRENRNDDVKPEIEVDKSFEAEASWIFAYGGDTGYFPTLMARHKATRLEYPFVSYLAAIREVLKFIHYENFDVPFIGQYRRDYTHPLQTIGIERENGEIEEARVDDMEDLWAVYNASVLFHRVTQRKKKLIEIFENPPMPIEEVYKDLLQDINSLEDANDLEEYIRFYQKLLQEPTTQRKLPSSTKPIQLCYKHNITDMIQYFGLTPTQYQENLLRPGTHFFTDHSESPQALAERYCCADFPTATDVLEALRFLVATQILHEPFIRKLVRQKYEVEGTLDVHLTKKGAGSTYKPPVSNITIYECRKSQEVLQLLRAQEGGLITMELRLEDEAIRQALQFDDVYLSSRQDMLAKEWNLEREGMFAFLLQFLKRSDKEEGISCQILKSLKADAEDLVLRDCVDKFKGLATQPLYYPPDTTNFAIPEGLPGDLPITACVYVAQQKEAFFVHTDRNGEYVEHMIFSWTPHHVTTKEGQQLRAQREQNLSAFLARNKPAVIAVATSSVHCVQFHKSLVEFLMDNALSKNALPIPVVWVSDSVAKIYAVSHRAEMEHPELKFEVRQGISIGRRLRDPLCEIAGLFNPEKDILGLELHPHQRLIPENALVERLEQVMAQTVSIVGVNINRLIRHPHMYPMLQFVGGLGPRKAQQLLQRILQPDNPENVRSRKALTEEYGLPPRVYTNCAGFIQVVDAEDSNNKSDSDRLDATRIHPDNYTLAAKVAADALEVQDTSHAIEEIMLRPALLDDLDLESGAQDLEARKYGKKLDILYMIKFELSTPYHEKRDTWTPISKDDLFVALTHGPVPAQSSLFTATIRTVRDNGWVTGVLDNGLTLSVRPEETNDDQDASRFRPGDMVTGVVMLVDLERFLVNGSLLPSKVQLAMPGPEAAPTTPILMGGVRKRRKDRYHRGKHVNHACWKDITRVEAEELIRNEQWSLPIIRPSSAGAEFLTITFRMYKNKHGYPVFNNIDVEEIKEEGRPPRYVVNCDEKKEKLEDLDEVIARWVDPIIEHVQSLLKNDYFEDGQEEINVKLERLKQEEPSRIHYRFAEDPLRTGKFMIFFIDKSIKQIPFVVCNEGFKLPKASDPKHRGPFATVQRLADGFKRYYSDWKQRKIRHYQQGGYAAHHSAFPLA